MRSVSTQFEAKHDLRYKTPMYLIHFDGKSTDIVNHLPSSSTNTCVKWLVGIGGAAQRVTPEEGRASVGGTKIRILDKDDKFTAFIAADSYYLHRKKTTIKAGYAGLKESEMATIQTGWLTGMKLAPDGITYELDITDPLKWLQRKVFRDATEASPVTISGNPITLLLAVLTSTGNGTNGDYDYLGATEGLGLDDDHIDVTSIENVRDDWFPDLRFSFTITEPIQTKSWIENQILKVLNCYPVIDGQGRFSIKPYKPPLAATDTVQTLDKSNIVGIPKWDAHLKSMINEVEFHYGYDSSGDTFAQIDYYINADSVNNRGPGKSPLVIEAKGVSTGSLGEYIGKIRKERVFQRFATPPTKVNVKTHFSRHLTEAGDIIPVSSTYLPDLENSTRGFSEERMEVVNRTVDWKRGQVSMELWNTGFARNVYRVISPSGTIINCTSTNTVRLSTGRAEKFSSGDIVDVMNGNFSRFSSGLTIASVSSELITFTGSMATQATTRMTLQYSKYDAVRNSTNNQDLYAYIDDSTQGSWDATSSAMTPSSSGSLGASSDLPHLIVA